MLHQGMSGRGREHERIVADRRVIEVRDAIVERDDRAVERRLVNLLEQRLRLVLAPDQAQVRQRAAAAAARPRAAGTGTPWG